MNYYTPTPEHALFVEFACDCAKTIWRCFVIAALVTIVIGGWR